MARFSLLRVLLPSWRFFDRIGTPLRAQFRVGPKMGPLGEWQDLQMPLDRRPWNLFLNPDGNVQHALQSLTERFLMEAQDFAATPFELTQPTLESGVTYQLMLNWAKRRARARHSEAFIGRKDTHLQFRVSAALEPAQRPVVWTEAVLSLVHPYE